MNSAVREEVTVEIIFFLMVSDHVPIKGDGGSIIRYPFGVGFAANYPSSVRAC